MANDRLGRYIEGCSGNLLTVQLIQQKLNGLPSQRIEALTHSCKRRSRKLGDLNIIKTNNGHIARQLIPRFLQYLHETNGVQISTGDESRTWEFVSDQLLPNQASPHFLATHRIKNELRSAHEPTCRQCLLITYKALLHIRIHQLTDKSNSLVPMIDQMLHNRTCTASIIGENEGVR